MATIINNPGDPDVNAEAIAEGTSMGLIFGILISLLLIIAFIAYFLPMIRADQAQTPTDTDPKIQIDLTLPPRENSNQSTY